MAFKLNPHIYPPGGYRYTDIDKVVHEGVDLADLVKVITRYRKATGKPVGDPEQEVLSKICARTPAICFKTDPKVDLKSLAIYVSHYLHKAFMELGNKGMRQTTTPDVAAQRAEICATCPHRVNWINGCAPCSKASDGLARQVITPNRPIKGTEDFACLIAHDSLAVAVYDINPKPVRLAPDHCWRKEPKS